MTTCERDGCDLPSYSKGWCQSHYGQERRMSDPAALARIAKKTRAKGLGELRADPDDRRHGTVTGSSLGCRCLACNSAKLDREKHLPWVVYKIQARPLRRKPMYVRHATEAAAKRYIAKRPFPDWQYQIEHEV